VARLDNIYAYGVILLETVARCQGLAWLFREMGSREKSLDGADLAPVVILEAISIPCLEPADLWSPKE
jgi:hypothetical protein